MRELNGTSRTYDQHYLDYVNAHCPALNTTKTWRSIAVGFLAITDTDPCGVNYAKNMANAHGERHKPQALRLAVFDGNRWRQLAAGRFYGLDKTVWPPPWDPGPSVGTAGTSDDFEVTGGTVRVVVKITTDWIMIYATTSIGGANQAYHGAAIPRIAPVYTDAFDTIRWGVGAGCELDPASGACKSGGTPRQCLTYSRYHADVPVGYQRTLLDAASIYNGELRYVDMLHGRCCKPDGTCEVVDELACTNAGGTFIGINKSCDGSPCAGACCQPRGACTQTPVNACPGDFKGYGTLCTTQGRCPCPMPFADYDHNGYVDMDDFAGLQICLTSDTPIAAACACFDRDADGRIDDWDLLAFTNCASGTSIPWAPTPSCLE